VTANRVLEGGGQCGLLLFRSPQGALFCYEHGETRRSRGLNSDLQRTKTEQEHRTRGGVIPLLVPLEGGSR
jgi:hypothetical protein